MHALNYLLISQLIAAATAVAPRHHRKRAAYFLDNNPAGASIVSLVISPEDGTLSSPVRTSTKGIGLMGVVTPANGTGPPAPIAADTLFSQDAVVVSGDYLFTINPGSNTVVMFSIDEADPYHPTMVGDPVSTVGTFPQSVAYSPKHATACVLNGGTVPGIACFSVKKSKGLHPIGRFRPIALNQTDPPLGPGGTVSDIRFNPSETALFAAVKSDIGTIPGFIYAYPIDLFGSISTTPIVSRPADLIVDFGFSFLGHDSRGVVADATYGASIIEISPTLEVNVVHKTTVPNQGAICWTVYSSFYDAIYLMDLVNSNITVLDPKTGAIKGTIAQATSALGSADTFIDREWLYVLKSNPSISVIGDLGNIGKQVQSFDLSSLGSRQGYQGFAVYPSLGDLGS